MLDTDLVFLWVVRGILLQAITIVIRFFTSVCNVCFILLLLSLPWLGVSESSSGLLRLSMEFAM